VVDSVPRGTRDFDWAKETYRKVVKISPAARHVVEVHTPAAGQQRANEIMRKRRHAWASWDFGMGSAITMRA